MHGKMIINLVNISQFQAPSLIRKFFFLCSLIFSLPEFQYKGNHRKLLFRFYLSQYVHNLSLLSRRNLIPININNTNIRRIQTHRRKSLNLTQILRYNNLMISILQTNILKNMIRSITEKITIWIFERELISFSDQM